MLRFYEMRTGGLGEFFAGLAADWRGWRNDLTWTSLEGDVELAAARDGLGIITVTVQLRTEALRASPLERVGGTPS